MPSGNTPGSKKNKWDCKERGLKTYSYLVRSTSKKN